MDKKIVNQVDCHLIIKKCVSSGTFEIVNFKISPFEDKAREYYKSDSILEISVKVSKNISRFRFFLKKFYTKHAPLNDLLTCAKASEREIFFQENVLPGITESLQEYEADFVPQYLLGKVNDFMIMEDMSLRSYVMTKKVNPYLLDRFHVCLALKALAKLHAGSLCYKEIKMKLLGAKEVKLFKEENVIMQEPLWKKEEGNLGYQTLKSGVKGIKMLLVQLQQLEVLDDSLSQKIDVLVEKCLELIKPQTEYCNVLCHGNPNTKNLLFKYENTSPVHCVLLNFSYCRYFLPAYDVLNLIFLTSSKLFRQHYFTYLIQYYHDCLHNEMTKQGMHVDQVLTFNDFKHSINHLMPLIKLRTVLHLQEFGAKDGFYRIMKKDENAYRHFLFDDKAAFSSEVIKKDPIFKGMIIESLEELLDTINDSRISRENCYEILEERLETTVYELNDFYVSPNQHGNLELTMTVCLDSKEGTINEYKYLIESDLENGIKIINQIQ